MPTLMNLFEKVLVVLHGQWVHMVTCFTVLGVLLYRAWICYVLEHILATVLQDVAAKKEPNVRPVCYRRVCANSDNSAPPKGPKS